MKTVIICPCCNYNFFYTSEFSTLFITMIIVIMIMITTIYLYIQCNVQECNEQENTFCRLNYILHLNCFFTNELSCFYSACFVYCIIICWLINNPNVISFISQTGTWSTLQHTRCGCLPLHFSYFVSHTTRSGYQNQKL